MESGKFCPGEKQEDSFLPGLFGKKLKNYRKKSPPFTRFPRGQMTKGVARSERILTTQNVGPRARKLGCGAAWDCEGRDQPLAGPATPQFFDLLRPRGLVLTPSGLLKFVDLLLPRL